MNKIKSSHFGHSGRVTKSEEEFPIKNMFNFSWDKEVRSCVSESFSRDNY